MLRTRYARCFASLFLIGVFLFPKYNATSGKTTPTVLVDRDSIQGASAGRRKEVVGLPWKLDGQWSPPDVDQAVPDVDPSEACSLPEVLTQVGNRVEELVHNLERFSATEVIQHQKVSRSGRLRRPEIDTFNYMALVTESNDSVNVDEYRQGTSGSQQFPDHIETKGVTGLILVFHPSYAKGFDMKCEGLGEWQGQPAWQVHFSEKLSHYMCGIVLPEGSFGVRIRGRAWILASSYQVVRLETDLADEIPKIRLRLQHEEIEYSPVHFSHANIDLWLPSSAELYMDFIGHRFYRRHSFTEFRLFDVTVQQFLRKP